MRLDSAGIAWYIAYVGNGWRLLDYGAANSVLAGRFSETRDSWFDEGNNAAVDQYGLQGAEASHDL